MSYTADSKVKCETLGTEIGQTWYSQTPGFKESEELKKHWGIFPEEDFSEPRAPALPFSPCD